MRLMSNEIRERFTELCKEAGVVEGHEEGQWNLDHHLNGYIVFENVKGSKKRPLNSLRLGGRSMYEAMEVALGVLAKRKEIERRNHGSS